MPRMQYIAKRFSKKSRDVIDLANSLITQYQDQGLKLTLRQLYYRFVASGWIPNKANEYKKLGSTINDARLAGMIDWSAIEDRGRSLLKPRSWLSPAHLIKDGAEKYAIDLWADQACRVEVWVEKEALIGVIERASGGLNCPCFACKGYVSQSEMWRAGQRLFRIKEHGQTPVIIHLGDHDPSGMDMTRDIFDRLGMFVGEKVDVIRIALNMDQIQEYDPPPNPAKITDSRSPDYIRRYGNSSWELDALEPQVLHRLIQDAITRVLDEDKYHDMFARQETERRELVRISERLRND